MLELTKFGHIDFAKKLRRDALIAMKRFVKTLCVVFLVSIMGCGHLSVPFFGKKPDESKAKHQQPDIQSTEFIDKGRIVNAQKLKDGRNIAIVPFTAGEGAESTDELDRVALMIIKGVVDAFADDKTGKHAHFNVLMAENSKDADLIVSGHITAMGGLSKLKRWVLLSSKNKLSVEGKITDVQSGEAVVIFTDSLHSKAKDADYKQLGYDLGKNIGRFILSGIN